MKIAVYLGSSEGNKPIYKEKVIALGEWLAKNGHTLVYGGSKAGLMGILAETVLQNGGQAIGVNTRQLDTWKGSVEGLSELHIVDTMAQRKTMMLEIAEAYIAFPGGIGTLEEIFEAMSREKLKISERKAVFYNIDGYYNSLYAMFQHMIEEGFLPEENAEIFRLANNLEEIEKMIL